MGDFTFWISLSLSPKNNLTVKFWTESNVRISGVKTKWRKTKDDKTIRDTIKNRIDVRN